MNFEWLQHIRWFYPKTIAALNIFALSENSFRGEIVVAALKKKKIDIIEKQIVEGTLETICEKLPKQMSVCLSVDGKGILYKEWDDELVSRKKIFKELLPQGNYNDFYLHTHQSGEKNIITIARQNYINQIINNIEKNGNAVIDIIVGPFVLNRVHSFVKNKDQQWNLPCRTIEWNSNSSITALLPANYYWAQDFVFGDDKISSDIIISFSHAFIALISPESLNNEITIVRETRQNQYYKKAISYVGSGILVFYLIILLVNYLAFTSLSSKLSYTFANYESSIKILDKLDEKTIELQQKEELAKRIGAGNKDQLSFYADRLAASIPSYITLTQLSINPLNKKRVKKDTPEFNKGIIAIKGNISSGIRLYKWIEKLDKHAWIKKVEVKNISHEVLEKPAEFEIEIEFSPKKAKE